MKVSKIIYLPLSFLIACSVVHATIPDLCSEEGSAAQYWKAALCETTLNCWYPDQNEWENGTWNHSGQRTVTYDEITDEYMRAITYADGEVCQGCGDIDMYTYAVFFGDDAQFEYIDHILTDLTVTQLGPDDDGDYMEHGNIGSVELYAQFYADGYWDSNPSSSCYSPFTINMEVYAYSDVY